MGIEIQQKVLELAELYDRERLMVILGISEAEAAGLSAEAVTAGDPAESGPLTGVSLGLSVYHIFELKDQIDPQVYEKQCGTMEMLLDVEDIKQEVGRIRQSYSKH
jgi:glycine reductase